MLSVGRGREGKTLEDIIYREEKGARAVCLCKMVDIKKTVHCYIEVINIRPKS